MKSPSHAQVANIISSFQNEESPLLRHDETDDCTDDEEQQAGTDDIASSVRSVQSIQSNLPTSIQPTRNMTGTMQIKAFQLSREVGLIECSQEEALAGARLGGSKHYWIDIKMNCNNEVRPWMENLCLPNFAIDVLAEPPENWASQVIPLPKALLVVVRIVTDPSVTSDDRLTHQAALQLRNMIVTFQNNSMTNRADSLASKMSAIKTRMKSVSLSDEESLRLQNRFRERRHQSYHSQGALLTWLRLHLDQTAQRTRTLRFAVVRMDESMDRDVTSVDLSEIISCKDELLRILSVAEEQTACLEHLTAASAVHNLGGTRTQSSTSSVSSQSRTDTTSMSILLATAHATERMSLRLEKHVTDLRQRCQGYEQEVMNRRLALLTVLSAVFLPLTLFTGIWGMNFQNMPELSKPYSYPLALMFMIFIAALMIFYFRRSGWFD